ncbi:sterigmatocystin biosynthesis monooxygenase StcW [Paracoccidioides lutzii Pb01]|uniref:Sterigmatocystin biosynthesis monooxygenase StcW n=1 Tax=Paracoccidioides lutzii (strain ATCC MYA-826 / Pb01) TaxID=502779 RepID=C1H1A0_PARBA|nr:sterigmatocystin biosynthesis monooxygenase StcW [Paracoccidioides lutzii Pb01]EEH33494.1 sterigmatocystin biosynthesis monooxygenase StcW [Paracoccidioides lutzii Pb01]
MDAAENHAENSPQGYEIDKDVIFGGRQRKVKVLIIGAGKDCQNVEHVIYEKNNDIGGTWLENRYPNCACDVPSHAYAYNFAPNVLYLEIPRSCLRHTFNLRKYMTFNTLITGSYWEEEEGEWRVTLRQIAPDGTERETEERCNPDIEGLERFKGRMIHRARWPKDYQEEQWKGERVAVIGSGASSIQTVPGMQPHVKHLDIFVRTAIWFVQIAGHTGTNGEYSEKQRQIFRENPKELVKESKFFENQINEMWSMFYRDSEPQAQAQEALKARMAEWIKDERLLKEDGLVGEDGVERKVDTIVCATGFDVSYRPRFPIVGQNGVDLRDKWAQCPEAYLGLAVPGFPNYMTFIGPTWPVENGSVMGPLMEVGNYAIKLINKIQNENIQSLTPRQDITDAFNEHAQEWVKHTVWTDDCRSWYRNNETGRVNAVYPGSSLHYLELISTPRVEDYTISYVNKMNMWSFLGMGKARPDVNPHSDFSPYLSEENIDPKWLEEICGKGKGESSMTGLVTSLGMGVVGLFLVLDTWAADGLGSVDFYRLIY